MAIVEVEIETKELIEELCHHDWREVVNHMADRFREEMRREAMRDVQAGQDYQSAVFIKGQIDELKGERQRLKDEVAKLRKEKRSLEGH